MIRDRKLRMNETHALAQLRVRRSSWGYFCIVWIIIRTFVRQFGV